MHMGELKGLERRLFVMAVINKHFGSRFSSYLSKFKGCIRASLSEIRRRL